ncbi:uncharacterized protein FOMMEDRAFT_162356 [Fomitiporia mediterranea MF3/22]|uniref:uncharacterized protein n=1 Tax=Fomitiporia mediterranea (strain MF3/22) TaxID=694068 RepID=UPI0004408468|nr:uncharacterized protein FOMMEDRAFT_162356 [Fomitiporia mediterranea MF3/22]EJC98011.1 hypothetical protein FOMMEDRAFT_162356 [Fomitiporia mediterranea MF3/22]
MASNYYVKVANLSEKTEEPELRDFFAFCGKIESIDFNKNGDSTVYFEKPSAVSTALMLNDGTLDGAKLLVTADQEHPDEDHESPQAEGEPIAQEDKPRAGIAAEYLAKGYTLSDQILDRAIKLDQERGISKRFLSYFQSLDSTIGAKTLGPEKTVSGKVQETLTSATERARAIDEQKGISTSLHDYYAKAVNSPIGQRVKSFYMTTNKQLKDIHEEARHIADSHKPAPGTTTGVAAEQPVPAPAAPPAATESTDTSTLPSQAPAA